jgi:rubrerythrin
LDIDAAEAYNQALRKIDDTEVFQTISHFRNDHLRHIKELSAAVISLGGKPIEHKQDIKGYFIEGFTALRSITGMEGALKAMQGNERITTARYERALHMNFPPNLLALVQRNYADEARHLSQIQRLLETKPWKVRAEAL